MIEGPIKKLQKYLEQNALDAFLVLTKLNRQYVSGFTGSRGAVLVTKNHSELYVDDRYTIRAKRESPLPVRPFSSLPLRGRVREGWRIGIEDKISVCEFQKLKQDYKGVKFTTTSNVIENLRAVKSADEFKKIKKAATIIDRIFSAEKIRSIIGKTEIAVAQDLERLAIKYGADGMAFESIVAFGANAAAPHHLSGKQKIKKNNFLLMDFGVLVSGFHSDFTRTLFIGSPSRKQEKIYNTVLEAQKLGIEKAIASNPAAAVDAAARGHIAKAGFGKYFTHNTGHGVGLEIHELPNFSTNTQDILRSDMVVTVEPGIYIEKWGGVRIEDMILVGKDSIALQKSPRDLKSMIIN